MGLLRLARRPSLVALGLLPLVSSARSPGAAQDGPAERSRAAEQGSAAEQGVIERTFVSELDLSTERFELAGTEGSRSRERKPPRHVRQQAFLIETSDMLLDDGVPPARFTRFYRTVTSSYQVAAEGEPPAKVATAGLEGKRVTFERDAHGRYARSCDDEDVRGGQLRRLRAELALADWLPSGELAPGAKLEIPFAVFARLLSPLDEGSASRRAYSKRRAPPTGFNVSPVSLSEPLAVLFGAAEGTAIGTLRRGDADAELPRTLDLEFRFENVSDGAASILAGVEGEAEDEVELVYSGTGTLAWDPDTGAIAVACTGELEIRESFAVRVVADGTTTEVKGEIVLSGTLDLEGREERGD